MEGVYLITEHVGLEISPIEAYLCEALAEKETDRLNDGSGIHHECAYELVDGELDNCIYVFVRQTKAYYNQVIEGVYSSYVDACEGRSWFLKYVEPDAYVRIHKVNVVDTQK